MLLRSSSTPVLGSLLPCHSESPNNNLSDATAKHPPSTIYQAHNKLSLHQTGSLNLSPVSFNSSPISPSVNAGHRGFRRAQSDGNLKGLAYASCNNNDELSTPNLSKKSSQRPSRSMLQTIPSFSFYGLSRMNEEEENDEEEEEEEEEEEPHQLPSPSPPNPALQFSVRKLSLGNPRILMGFLGVSLFVFLLWNFASSSPLVELRRKNDDREPTSFILPLYPKLGSRSLGDLELKLGKFVDFHVNDMKPGGINKLATSVSAFDSSTIFPVRGDVYPNGLYFTHIFVGSPPRRYFLDMDTGSDLTWIQCDAPCTSCAKGPNPLYKPKKGNLVPLKDSLCVEVQRNLKTGYCETCEQCDYEIEYADHSSSMGVLASDDLHLMLANGSLTKLGIMFGCAYDQQGLLLNSLAKTDGILGLSKAKVSLPSQLASQRIINNVLGHCLTSDATGGGYMFLGDDFVPYWGMAWVPMLNSHSPNYHSQIMKISHGSRQLSLGRQDGRTERVVFDTGSSYTYFPKEAYYALVASLKDVSDEGLIQDGSDPTLPVCWRAKFPIRSVIDVKQFFQPLTLQFRSKWWIVSTKFRIPPEGYLIISNKGNVCLGILDGSNVHDGSTIILGDISLRGKLVVYDNVNQKIGWAQSTCVKPQKIKSLPFF